MPHLLDLVDRLIGDVLQGNMFSDSAAYRATLGSQPQQIPANAFGHIPNADPRRLNLTPGVGFQHAHDPLSAKASPRHQNAQGVPVIPQPMHDTTGVYTNPSTGIIDGSKRQGFYADNPNQPPQDITQQTANLAADTPPPPSEQARRLARGAIYDTPGRTPLSVQQQVANLLSNKPPPPGAYSPPGTAGPTDQTVRQLSRESIYGPSNTPPLNPAQQRDGFEANKPSPTRELSRPEIYGPSGTPPLQVGDEGISPSQHAALKSDSPPPPGAFSPPGTRGPLDQTIRQLDQPEIYASDGQRQSTIGPNDSLLALANWHEAQRPFTPTGTAERRLGPSLDGQVPKTPADAGATQQRPGDGIGAGDGNVVNEFANSPHRPLNFAGADDAPDRLDLVAKYHPQKFGWNASGLEGEAQRRGTITDNLYDDTDTPFDGNFQSVFRGPVPPQLNYFNILATGPWLRNIGKELFLGNLDSGFQDGGPPGTDGDLASTVQGLAKGAAFVANQFLLTAMNPANPANGIANAIWNPLSITAAIPAAGGFISDITAGAASGLGVYGDNIKAVDAAGASMLLLARRGAHSEARPLERLTKFLPPLSPPGFIGSTVGVDGDTLDKNQ